LSNATAQKKLNEVSSPPASPSPESTRPPGASPDRPEFSLSAVLIGLLVAAFVGASYPYVVLKIGFGPNISVVSAFFGYMALTALGLVFAKKGTRYEWNIVQTAGTAAGQAGFMCIVLAALDMLAAKPELGIHLQLSTLQIFLWLSIAGALGVLLAVPLRRHYIDEENLTFADGVAAGETLLILDADRRTAKRRVMGLVVGGVLSAILTWFRDGKPKLIPEDTFFGSWAEKLHIGMSWGLLSIGSGLLVGLRVTLSMGLGMVIGWFVAPPALYQAHFITDQAFAQNLRWVMWPATGLMVAGGITALVLKWKVILRTFTDFKLSSMGETDFPIKWVGLGSLVLAVALIILQKVELGIAVWVSALAILISVPLMLVGTRVLGETNWAPISSLANLVQLVFAVVVPGNATVNMVASGMSGTIGANGEHLMQDYKAGKLIGSNNRYLTYMQLLSVPVGAISVALVYPVLRAQYGIGADRYGLNPALANNGAAGLTSPTSVRWSGFAELLSAGLDHLPPYALHALGVAVVVGVLLTYFEATRKWLPSPTGVGLGMLIAPNYVLPMVVGGLIQWGWQRANPKQEEEMNTPIASGFIVGEALLALIIPLLFFFKWL